VVGWALDGAVMTELASQTKRANLIIFNLSMLFRYLRDTAMSEHISRDGWGLSISPFNGAALITRE